MSSFFLNLTRMKPIRETEEVGENTVKKYREEIIPSAHTKMY